MHRDERLQSLDLLFRGREPKELLKIFSLLDEEVAVAVADAGRESPGDDTPEARKSRAFLRRHKINLAILRASEKLYLPVRQDFSKGKGASFAIARVGAFSIVPARLRPAFRSMPRSLSSRPAYMKEICARNGILDPQGDLFLPRKPDLIPDGALGAVLVTEYDGPTPGVASFVGLLIPSPDLKKELHCFSLKEIKEHLRKLIISLRPKRPTKLVRKMPQLKKRPGRRK